MKITSRNALYLLLAFCGGLMLPVFIVWMQLVPQTPAEAVPTNVPASAQKEEIPQIAKSLGYSTVPNPLLDKVGYSDFFITDTFKKLLISNPSCDAFIQKYLTADNTLSITQTEGSVAAYQLPKYFLDPANCVISKTTNDILIGSLGIQPNYEGGGTNIDASIVWIDKEGSMYLLSSPGEIANLKEQSLLSNLRTKYNVSEDELWTATELWQEYDTELKTYLNESDEIVLARKELYSAILNALNIDPKTNLDLSTLPQVHVDTNHDVYYIAFEPTFGGPESTLIAAAEHPPTCPGADGTSFCQKQYYRATISPNGKWVLLEASCWEDNCYSVYDIVAEKRYALNASPLSTHWLPDSRLYGDGGFTTPRVVPSGAWESVSVTTPWQMQKVSE